MDFGVTQNQAHELVQGWIWGLGGMFVAICAGVTGLLGFLVAVICAGIGGFIMAVMADAASRWRYFSYRIISFTYGWQSEWWGGYPFFRWAGTY